MSPIDVAVLESGGADARARRAEPWWKGATIYHIYPRSFRDTNGDGVGDLPGIVEHLPYIASLHVDAIWISPFFTSPMRDFGYDVADYCDVDPTFGTLADFDRLIARAHELGLRVIIDQVYSHTSSDHRWFEESRADRTNAKADWYVWADAKPDGSPPSNWQSVFGGPAWRWDGRRKQYYLHNFLASQPQLNVHHTEVQNALLDVARFWLDKGVDGFRLDAINFSMHDPNLTDNPPSGAPLSEVTRPFDLQHHAYNQSHPDIAFFLERVRALLDAYGARFTVAEVGGPEPLAEMRAFTHGETRLNSAYGFDFLYAPEIFSKTVHESMAQWPGDPGEGWPSWAFSNHDAPRAVSRWSGGRETPGFAKLYLALLLSLRGNVFLYQGEELGLPQAHVAFEDLQDPEALENWPHTLGRDGARTPFPWTDEGPHAGFSEAAPWLPVDPRHVALAQAKQDQLPGSVLAFARDALATRRSSAVLRHGSLTMFNAPDGVVSFERQLDDVRMSCVFNLTDEPIAWRPDVPTDRFRVRLSSSEAYRVDGCAPETLRPNTGYWSHDY